MLPHLRTAPTPPHASPRVPPGNENVDLRTTSPAACAAAITVTALSSTGRPAGFSNWLPSRGVSQADLDRTLAAPGVDIRSTLPSGGYINWQGT